MDFFINLNIALQRTTLPNLQYKLKNKYVQEENYSRPYTNSTQNIAFILYFP